MFAWSNFTTRWCFLMHSFHALIAALVLVVVTAPHSFGATVFVEAESFAHPGGWQLDTQFIQQMGSPYLLAHGLGKPVEDA